MWSQSEQSFKSSSIHGYMFLESVINLHTEKGELYLHAYYLDLVHDIQPQPETLYRQEWSLDISTCPSPHHKLPYPVCWTSIKKALFVNVLYDTSIHYIVIYQLVCAHSLYIAVIALKPFYFAVLFDPILFSTLDLTNMSLLTVEKTGPCKIEWNTEYS